MSDTAVCPVCGYSYRGRGLTEERRQLASAIALQRHAAATHGLSATDLVRLRQQD